MYFVISVWMFARHSARRRSVASWSNAARSATGFAESRPLADAAVDRLRQLLPCGVVVLHIWIIDHSCNRSEGDAWTSATSAESRRSTSSTRRVPE
jgi:hypothetical protein